MTFTLRTKQEDLAGPVRVAALDWIPLERAAICLDCSGVFAINRDGCPSCGSAVFSPLAKWLRERTERRR